MVTTIINIILVEDLLARTTHSKGSADQHISLLASLAYAVYILTVCKGGVDKRGMRSSLVGQGVFIGRVHYWNCTFVFCYFTTYCMSASHIYNVQQERERERGGGQRVEETAMGGGAKRRRRRHHCQLKNVLKMLLHNKNNAVTN